MHRSNRWGRYTIDQIIDSGQGSREAEQIALGKFIKNCSSAYSPNAFLQTTKER